jgi:meso-butanediol dehydrogenase/(S,S)-butanediol dehydrogenase/diacetyl reductase
MNAWLNTGEKSDLVNKIALNRFGNPCEIARAALFLASGDASYITGAILAADGGI